MDQGNNYLISDLKKLANNCVTFAEMKANDCVIPPMGAINNIKPVPRDRLVGLLALRFRNPLEIDVPPSAETETPLEKAEATPIGTPDDIKRNAIRRASRLREINPDETDQQERSRVTKQIAYTQNADAQERASRSHRDTLFMLAEEMKRHGITPMESVIDLLAEKGGGVFIFEVKSIHAGNLINQTRYAIGQLLEYEYSVKQDPAYAGKGVTRGIMYSKKPDDDGRTIRILRSCGFHIFWVENGKIAGEPESMAELNRFLAS